MLKGFVRFFSILILVASYAGSASAQKSCSKILQIDGRIGEVARNATEAYEIEGRLKRIQSTPPKNQGKSLECYLFSFVEGLEVFNRNHPDPVRKSLTTSFSAGYLFMKKIEFIIEQSLKQTGDPDTDSLPFFRLPNIMAIDGGTAQDALLLMRKYGLVPDRTFNPKELLAKWEPERTAMKIQKEITKVYRRLRNERIQQEKNGTFDKQKFLAHAEKEAHRLIEKVIVKRVGPVPDPTTSKIHINDEYLTPLEIEERYGFPRNVVVYSEYPWGRSLFGNAREFMNGYKELGAKNEQLFVKGGSLDQVMATMRTAIDHGQQVQVSLIWNEPKWRGYHVETLIGYETEPNDHAKVKNWLFANTFGRWADNGQVFYQDADIRKNIVDANLIVEPEAFEKMDLLSRP